MVLHDIPSHDPYLLPRSAEEALKLERQHQVLCKATGLLYHPSLGDLSSLSYVLDCGTGTTAWARHVLSGGVEGGQQVKLNGRANVETCDYSAVQVPIPLPHGIRDFFTQDILKAFPKERQDRYDLIHQRFLSGGIPAGRWPQALHNLLGGLRPGGALALHEAGFPLVSAKQNSHLPTPSYIDRYSEMSTRLCSLAGVHSRLHEDLPEMLRQAGYVDVQVHRYLWPLGASGSHLGPAYVSSSLATAGVTLCFTGPMPSAVDLYQGEEGIPSRDEAARVYAGMLRELEQDGGYLPCIMVVGRRPADD